MVHNGASDRSGETRPPDRRRGGPALHLRPVNETLVALTGG